MYCTTQNRTVRLKIWSLCTAYECSILKKKTLLARHHTHMPSTNNKNMHYCFSSGNGSLSVEEFMSLPDLQQNPLVQVIYILFASYSRNLHVTKIYIFQRVIEIFDDDGNGEVDFRGIFLIILHFFNTFIHADGIYPFCRVHQWNFPVQRQGRQTHQTAMLVVVFLYYLFT